MPRVILALTGHGYGHAARMSEVLLALFHQEPTTECLIIGAIPQWLFHGLPAAQLSFLPRSLDTGAIERTVLSIDQEATLREALTFWAKRHQAIEEILPQIAPFTPQIVLADVPPLGALLGERLEIPSVAVSNFTWDFIYRGFGKRSVDADAMIDEMAAMRRLFTTFLRLPFAHPMPDQPLIVDTPLIARTPSSRREQTRARLGLRAEEIVVLVALRAADLQLPIETMVDRPIRLLTFGEVRGSNALLLGADENTQFPHLLAAADLVLTKPGYGIVSECVAAEKPMILLERDGFAETTHLLRGLQGWFPYQSIPWHADGHLLLDADLLSISDRKPTKAIPLNGAEVVAEMLRRLA